MTAPAFDLRPAVREQTPLLVGLVSPSGAGKTFSALRLATGIQRVVGGKIAVIDTEARRALHYAHKFQFLHMPFGAPFDPDGYLARIQFCYEQGARTIVIDSGSHEHSGTGGLLEMHAEEHQRMGGSEKMKLAAWVKPKQAHSRLVNGMLQIPANFIWCFRAKEKLEVKPGRPPVDLGWMPIMSDDLIYEMTINCLLYPGANGVPVWSPEKPGERTIAKLPEQFREVFQGGPQLSEDIGEHLARWAAGAEVRTLPASELAEKYGACSDADTYARLENERRQAWAAYSKADKAQLKSFVDDAAIRLGLQA